MSYQVLARKWRPRDFDTMVGQEHVIKALVNALENNRLHHAYLFTGTRGVGKTTVARIIAKCLNCETGITSKPCGKCAACQEIDTGRFIDLIEVDAASRTKVEDTRELLDNVQYAPTRGRFKIYLIDEVHMLSGHSFNALLKTLEEPPEHVKFLLATTDPQKLPITVLSRCLQFNLKNLSAERIAGYLEYVLTEEKIAFEASALPLIADAANGSMRDALSLLDQAIAYTHGNMNEADVRAMLGSIEQTHIESLLRALANHDGQQLLAVSQTLAEFGADYSNVLEELLSALHQMTIAQFVPDALPTSHPHRDFYLEMAGNISKEDVQLYHQIAILGKRDLTVLQNKKHGFEMTLLRMIAFKPATQAVTTRKPTSTTIKQPITAIPAAIPQIMDWAALLPHLNLSGMLQSLATHCALKKHEGKIIELTLAKNHAALLNDGVKERLNAAISQYFGQSIELTIQIDEIKTETPAQQNQRVANEKHQSAINTIQSDPAVKAMMEQLGAKVDPGLIKAID